MTASGACTVVQGDRVVCYWTYSEILDVDRRQQAKNGTGKGFQGIGIGCLEWRGLHMKVMYGGDFFGFVMIIFGWIVSQQCH